jgi:hypothetical protein
MITRCVGASYTIRNLGAIFFKPVAGRLTGEFLERSKAGSQPAPIVNVDATIMRLTCHGRLLCICDSI